MKSDALVTRKRTQRKHAGSTCESMCLFLKKGPQLPIPAKILHFCEPQSRGSAPRFATTRNVYIHSVRTQSEVEYSFLITVIPHCEHSHSVRNSHRRLLPELSPA